MKTYIVNQKELTADCWLVQIEGLEACKTCEAFGTPECGGKKLREQMLKGTKKPIGREL